MAEKKNSNLLVDDMRDYALITLMKTIRRLEKQVAALQAQLDKMADK